MRSYNGVGTTLYGKSNKNADGSYVATKWFVFLTFPIFPLGSYRVWKGEVNSNWSPVYSKTEYKMIEEPLNWKQVLLTYLIAWGGLALLIMIYLM